MGFIFLSLFWPPSESAIGGKNSFPPYVFTIVVGVCFGMTPGVLLRVTRACTLGVARMLARVVVVDDVCALFLHPLGLSCPTLFQNLFPIFLSFMGPLTIACMT